MVKIHLGGPRNHPRKACLEILFLFVVSYVLAVHFFF
jgi:hypothetical protein